MAELPHERLRKARIRAGYASAADAVRAFGWGESAYKHHENGTRGITIEVAKKYAKAYHVSPWYILTGEQDSLELPDGERAMLARFRLLTDSNQRVVLDLCDSLLNSQQPQTPPDVPRLKRPRRA